MSKSLGNYFTLRDLISQGHSPESIRYLLLSVHYRKQLNFTADGLRQAQASIQRLDDFMLRLEEKAASEAASPGFIAELDKVRARFKEAMDGDLNTSAALAVMFDFVRATNQKDIQNDLARGDARAALEFLREINGVLDILPPQRELLDREVAEQIEARQAARRRRDYAEADRIRNWLLSNGIQLEDTREGVRWKRIR